MPNDNLNLKFRYEIVFWSQYDFDKIGIRSASRKYVEIFVGEMVKVEGNLFYLRG